MAKGVKKVFRDGEWREGSAAPWLPPEHMRELPEALQTRDTTNPDAVHELDAPHVVEQLKADYAAKQLGLDPITGQAPKREPRYRAAKPGENVKLNQEQVDWIRMRVLKVLVDNAYNDIVEGVVPDLSVRHLWFPYDNVNIYQLRPGPAPRRLARPLRMRDLDLEVDIYCWPKRVLGLLAEQGCEVPTEDYLKRLRDRAMDEAAFRRRMEQEDAHGAAGLN